ncbi:MAG: SAF domain-containing protein [Planctomycetaceae bacterium]
MVGRKWFNRLTSVELIDLDKPSPIAKGNRFAFGQMIGFATEDIVPGEWIHGHNLGVGELGTDYEFATDIPPVRKSGRAAVVHGLSQAERQGRDP